MQGIFTLSLCVLALTTKSVTASLKERPEFKLNKLRAFDQRSGRELEVLEECVSKENICENGLPENAIISKEYISQAIPMKDGGMVFTKPWKTPLQMPTGEYFITGFHGDVVGENQKPVSLSELYTHHWIAEDMHHKNELCGPNYVFGIGAESRQSPVNFPGGYGYHVTDANDQWGGNLHFLHTKNLEPIDGSVEKAAKECNECWYAPNKGSGCSEQLNGTFSCCGETCYNDKDNCRCPVTKEAQAADTTTNFYLRYQVNYTRDQSTKPLSIGVITTPECATFYEVLRNDEEPESLSTTTFPVPRDMTLRLAIGHQHTGAINISLYKNGEHICTSYPTYGTVANEPGNELGHLVKMSTCIDSDNVAPVHFKKGDTFTIDAYYYVGENDERIAPSPGGTHLNVMAYMYMGYTVDDTNSTSTDANWWTWKNPSFRTASYATAGTLTFVGIISTVLAFFRRRARGKDEKIGTAQERLRKQKITVPSLEDDIGMHQPLVVQGAPMVV